MIMIMIINIIMIINTIMIALNSLQFELLLTVKISVARPRSSFQNL